MDSILEEPSEALLAWLRFEEGFRAEPYRDTRGHWTVGYGHLLADPVLKAACEDGRFGELDRRTASRMLRHDARRALQAVALYGPKGLGRARRDTLAVLAYQVGIGGFRQFVKMRQALEREDWLGAAGEILNSRLARQTPVRAVRLAWALMKGAYPHGIDWTSDGSAAAPVDGAGGAVGGGPDGLPDVGD